MRISLEEYCQSHGKKELLQQWDTEKNLPLNPERVSHGSGKKVWWLCEKGHTWPAVIANRSNGQECPCCRKRRGRSAAKTG